MTSSDVPSGQATPAIRTADILIVGGGLSGTLLAMQLLRLPGARHIVVLEPRAELGRGEAYSATELGHTLNGNAARMSVEPDDADDLTRWLQAHIAGGGWPESGVQQVPVAELFPPRGLFGVYARQRLAEAQAIGAAQGSSLSHVRDEVIDLQTPEQGVIATLKDGSQWQAGVAVLATGMFPAARTAQRQSSGLNAAALDPWDVQALRALPVDARVLIIGSGLTMVDALESLNQAGHRGPIEVFPGMACCPMCDASRRYGKIFSAWPRTFAVLCSCCVNCAANVPWPSPSGSTGRHRWTPCACISPGSGVRPMIPSAVSLYAMCGPGGRAIITVRRLRVMPCCSVCSRKGG